MWRKIKNKGQKPNASLIQVYSVDLIFRIFNDFFRPGTHVPNTRKKRKHFVCLVYFVVLCFCPVP